MARSPSKTLVVEPSDPFQDVAETTTEREAEEFGETLDALKNVTDNTAKIIVYKVGNRGGRWALCKEVYPPIDTSTLVDDLKAEYGAGDYKFRVFAGGKIRNTLSMSIEAGKSDKLPPANNTGAMSTDIIALIMQQSQSAASQQADMMRNFMQQQQMAQASAEARQAANMTNLIALAGIVAPLVLGNKDTPASMIGALAPLLQQDKGGMKEMLQTMAAAKELFAGDGGSGEPDSMIGGAVKSLIPLLAGAMQQPAPAPQQIPQQYRPNPAAPQIAHAPAPVPTPPPEGPTPLLPLVCARAKMYLEDGFDPELAGDCIIELLQKKGVTRDEILTLATALAQSGNYFETLKSHGFDFTGNEQWFNATLSHVGENYPDNNGSVDDSGRGSGGESDT